MQRFQCTFSRMTAHENPCQHCSRTDRIADISMTTTPKLCSSLLRPPKARSTFWCETELDPEEATVQENGEGSNACGDGRFGRHHHHRQLILNSCLQWSRHTPRCQEALPLDIRYQISSYRSNSRGNLREFERTYWPDVCIPSYPLAHARWLDTNHNPR